MNSKFEGIMHRLCNERDRQRDSKIANLQSQIETENTALAAYKEAVSATLNEVSKIATGPWIIVTDRKPEPGKEVIVWDDSEGLMLARFIEHDTDKNWDKYLGSDSYNHGFTLINVTHWMPLPNPSSAIFGGNINTFTTNSYAACEKPCR